MITLPYRVNNEPVQINVIENDDDLREAFTFIHSSRDYSLCVDTETTGLNIYGPNFCIRTLQIGDANTAYVYRLNSVRDRNARELLHHATRKGVTLHNRPFDLLAFDATGIARLEDTAHLAHCTKLLSHLVDPRSAMDGGIGHGLKNLSAFYIDETAVDTQDDLKQIFKETGTDWSTIDLRNETYLLYAGLDVIYGARLHSILRRLVNERSYSNLARMEHEYQEVTMRMQRRGFKIDTVYTQWLMQYLDDRKEQNLQTVKRLGVDNPNSAAQLIAFMQTQQWEASEFTRTGNPKMDKAVMQSILNNPNSTPASKLLIESVMASKQAGKWNTAYARAMYDLRDANDHVHASINSLQARTARSSISSPALQQLPSRGDDAWLIRRCVAADEGKLIISADLDQIEFRVLAALADITAMKHAIRNGIDLHDYTAELVYGTDFTRGQRSAMKGVGFGRVFGGGPGTLARQTGITWQQAKDAIDDYDRVYPQLPEYMTKLAHEARANGGYILTDSGRYMPLDPHRLYAAVNYSVQSPAADWLKQSIIRISKTPGLDDCLLLPVHDEALGQADAADAEEVARLFSECMSGQFHDVPITAGGEVYGPTWAHGYVYLDDAGQARSKGSNNPIQNWHP